MCLHNVDELVSARLHDYVIQHFSGAQFLGFSLFCGFRKYFAGAVLFYFRKQSSSASSYICHGVGPLVDPFRSHVSRSLLTLILRRSRTGTVWFYTSTSNKRAARPKLYTESLTRDLKLMYSRLTLVRISINL